MVVVLDSSGVRMQRRVQRAGRPTPKLSATQASRPQPGR